MRTLVTLLAAVSALAVSGTAQAGTPTNVNAFGCLLSGGHVTRPAGSEIVVRQGWAAKTRGLVEDFLNAQTTTLSVGGGSIDLSGSYGDPAGSLGDFTSFVSYPTGITLGAGDSLTFVFDLTVSHRLLDGATFADGDKGRPLFAEPGLLFESVCTVTGV